MSDSQRFYQSYLVRFQRKSPMNYWRVTLENASTGEVSRFATEKEFILYLLKQLAHDTQTLSEQQP